jgi:hypothetical protein
MTNQSGIAGQWVGLTVWGVVNAVNILQTVGFLSRVRTGSMATNHLLGYAIMALAIPAAVAFATFIRARADWLHVIGPGMFLAFVALMAVVDYARPPSSGRRFALASSCRISYCSSEPSS